MSDSAEPKISREKQLAYYNLAETHRDTALQSIATHVWPLPGIVPESEKDAFVATCVDDAIYCMAEGVIRKDADVFTKRQNFIKNHLQAVSLLRAMGRPIIQGEDPGKMILERDVAVRRDTLMAADDNNHLGLLRAMDLAELALDGVVDRMAPNPTSSSLPNAARR